METQIKNIEYLVPSPDKPIGSVTFEIEQIILHDANRKMPVDVEAGNVQLSEESVELAKKLAESIVKDLTK